MPTKSLGAGGTQNRWYTPDWDVPANVRSVVTTRGGDGSVGGYAAFNLARHVGDEAAQVTRNRQQLRKGLALPQEPGWLQQVHGTQVVSLPTAEPVPEADASVCRTSGLACVILTADCLPVLFCDDAGTVVAAAHAGWRGLLNGVLENTVQAMACAPTTIRAWLGPAIGPTAFEVGAEVREAFVRHDAQAHAAFVPSVQAGKYLADLYALARQRLQQAGVGHLSGGGACTYTDAARYYSFRREARCGRMASLVWLEHH